MEMIPAKKLDPTATLPSRAHADDAGLDIYSSEEVTLSPGEGRPIKTGIAMAIPVAHVGMIADRSSLGKRGLKTAGGIIDSGYRGEIQIILWNISPEKQILKKGERIAQLLILPIATPQTQEVTQLDNTTRGVGGFGSTGK